MTKTYKKQLKLKEITEQISSFENCTKLLINLINRYMNKISLDAMLICLTVK